ncbi:MAG: guanine deaminase [Pseudomonadota bacterium]|nr:guanine deaminase [Pseudomonadota bacterium]
MNKILRGRLLTFLRKPDNHNDTEAFDFLEDGYLSIKNGKITSRGQFSEFKFDEEHTNIEIIDHRPNIIMPGFIDVHNHFPQLRVLASYGTQLMDWLTNFTFPEEAKFSKSSHCNKFAKIFIQTLFNHGTTTSVSFGSVHQASVDSLFSEALAKNMCLIAGKVMMDRNAPKNVLDTPESSYRETKSLIEKWHKKERLKYAVSPRFCITSSARQLELAGALMKEFDDCYLQTHLSENKQEIALAMSLFPSSKDYLDIYAQHNLLGPKSLMGHSIHLSPREIYQMAETKTVAVHCPTSNLFLGSGLYNFVRLSDNGVRTAIASDTGGGTSFSMLQNLDAAYKIQQLQNYSLDPLTSFYWITLGNANALGLQNEIGSLESGRYADIVVLNSKATRLSADRLLDCNNLIEELFVVQTLGDDRFVEAVYVAGSRVK